MNLSRSSDTSTLTTRLSAQTATFRSAGVASEKVMGLGYESWICRFVDDLTSTLMRSHQNSRLSSM